MPVWLHNIETLVPETVYSQEYAGEKMQDFYDDPRTKRLIRAIYRKSGIVKRHSVVQNFLGGNAEGFFTKSPEGRTVEPTTAVRNEIFARESKRLSVALAKKVIDSCPGIGPKDITHVVTVSCTGFHNPGPDFHIVNELGISPTVVLCLELCTLHLQLTGGEDSLMANSLFGDGAGAAIVSSWKPEGDGLLFQAGSFNSALVPDGEAEMTWTLGDRGFDMTLSSYVPKIIGSNIRELIEPVLAKGGMKLEDVGAWAVHPGGKAIIDRVQDSLGLHPEQVQSSREVLRQFGNMSSATILFVLEDILRHPPERNHQLVCALAFGPGLTVEMALLRASKNCE
jgi:predicted naringenin-chalcone synthase